MVRHAVNMLGANMLRAIMHATKWTTTTMISMIAATNPAGMKHIAQNANATHGNHIIHAPMIADMPLPKVATITTAHIAMHAIHVDKITTAHIAVRTIHTDMTHTHTKGIKRVHGIPNHGIPAQRHASAKQAHASQNIGERNLAVPVPALVPVMLLAIPVHAVVAMGQGHSARISQVDLQWVGQE